MRRTTLTYHFGRLAAAGAALIGLLLLLGGTAAADTASQDTLASFEASNVPGQYIRHRNALGEISRIESTLDRADAAWIVRPALSGTPGAVSFESANYPGTFLRHQAFRIKQHRNDHSDLFKKDASFHIRPGLAGGDSKSFEAVNVPGQFIRHRNFELWIAASDGSDLFKQDASFRQGRDLMSIPGSFEAVNVPDHFVRHRVALGELTRVSSDLDRADATWIVRPSLSGTAGAVSFESVNYPGTYLRHQNFRIKQHPNDNSDLFKKDASFVVRHGLSGLPGSASFEAVNVPGHYIRHQNFELWVAKGDGSDLFKKDASFRQGRDLRNERDIRVNDALLRVATAETIGKAQIRLDRDQSFVRIPGIYDATFSLPTRLVTNPIKDAYYYVNDINSRAVTTVFKRGGVESCIDFETDDTEVIGYVKTFFDDMWDDGAPDANADPFTVCVWMPLVFDAATQSIRFQGFSLDVQVHAQWRYNGAGGVMQLVAAALLPDLNAGIERGFEGLLLNETIQARLSDEFSKGVRQLVGSAQITGIGFDGDTLLIHVSK